jgi:N-acetylneuraminic acid mutarotase
MHKSILDVLVFLSTLALAGRLTAQQLEWRNMAELPQPVAGYMAGVVDGKLLIIGGSYWENKTKRWIDSVQAFDPRSNTWQNEAPLPEPRSDGALGIIGNDIYIFGGNGGADTRNDAIVFHAGKWSALPTADLPQPRQYAAAISSRGSIYLLGGLSKAGQYESVTNTFWRWRPKQKGWETLPPLPGPGRINHAMAEINGEIYVLGGATTGPKGVRNLNDAYSFDPNRKRWTRLGDLPVSNRAWWAVGLGHRALVLGGYTDVFESRVYWYDPQHNLRSAGDLPHPLADAKFFRMGDMLVGTGGEAAAGIRGKWTMTAEIPKSTPRE